MKTVLERVQEKGYCCIFGYFISHRNWTTKQIAEALDINPRTVRFYKSKILDKKNICNHTVFCMFTSGELLQVLHEDLQKS